MHQPSTHIQETIELLRTKPGIDLKRQPCGSKIIVDTWQFLYEIEIVDQSEFTLLSVGGTDPRFRVPRRLILEKSIYDVNGKIFIPNWIGKDLRMLLTPLDGTTYFHCNKTLSARIEHDDWHYDVF